MVTAQERTTLIGLSVVMLGSAPGTARLSQWVDLLADGNSGDDLLMMLEDSDEFQMEYPVFLLDDDFADRLLTNLGLDTLDGAVFAAVVDIIVELLADVEDGGGGLSRGQVALLVTQALLDISDQGMDHPAYGDLGAAADTLANKVAVASHYTLDARMEMPSADVLMGVTDDPDTVMMAIDMIDNPPAPPPMGEVFTLTTRINRETGTDGDDLFIAHPSPAGTDTLSRLDNLDGGEGMDTLDLASTGNFELSSTVRVSNIETLVVNTDGSFDADLSSWMGLESIELQIIGSRPTPGPDMDIDTEIDNGKFSVDLNAGGAMVTAEIIGGEVNIQNASLFSAMLVEGNVRVEDTGMVDLMDVDDSADVIVLTGTSTTSVSVNGGSKVDIGTMYEVGDGGLHEISGQSESLTSVSLSGMAAQGASSRIHSNVLAELSLAGTSAMVTVTSEASEPVDLTVNVDGYGGETAGMLMLEGDGAAKNVSLVAGEGGGNINLTNRMAETLNVSGEGMVTLATASSLGMLKTVNISGMAGLTLSGTNLGKLETIDGSAAMGKLTLTGLKSNVKSVMTGGGDDMVTLTAHHGDGTMVDLGGGDDTFTTTAGDMDSRIEGGAGTDVLKMSNADHNVAANADGDSIYSGFEILDISPENDSSSGGSYNMTPLQAAGIREIQLSPRFASGAPINVTANNARAGTDVTFFGLEDEARHRIIWFEYNLADGSGDNDSVDINLVAVGGDSDSATSTTGDVLVEFRSTAIEEVVVNSTADTSANGGEVPASAYTNALGLTAPPGGTPVYESLIVNGDARISISATSAVLDLGLVDARGNSAGVEMSFGSATVATAPITFRGGMGDDMILARGESDLLIGGDGNDTLLGGAGDDVITGGEGADWMDYAAGLNTPPARTEEGGADTFRYTSASHSQLSFNDDKMAVGIDYVGFDATADEATNVEADKLGLSNVNVGLGDRRKLLIKDRLVDGDDNLVTLGMGDDSELMSYIGDGDNFFIQGIVGDMDESDQYAIALVQHKEGTLLFIDANGNGDLDLEADMVINLIGPTPAEFTKDNFILL